MKESSTKDVRHVKVTDIRSTYINRHELTRMKCFEKKNVTNIKKFRSL